VTSAKWGATQGGRHESGWPGVERSTWAGVWVVKDGLSGRLVRMLLSGQDLSRTGEAINRAAQHGRRSGARVESGRPTSKGVHYR
jgi:hypothetical protein